MRQVGEQDQPFLGIPPMLAAVGEMKAAFVGPEHLGFRPAPVVVALHQGRFAGHGEGAEVIAMPELALDQPPLDQRLHRTPERDGGGDPGQPTGAWGRVPPLHLVGQGFRPAVGGPFCQHLVVSGQQPIQVLVAAKAAIQSPGDSAALGRGELK